MIDIYEDSLNISASCPGNVAVNTETNIQGTVDYRLVNAGDEDGTVNIVVTLSDSAGDNTQFSSTMEVITAGGYLNDSHQLFLNPGYDAPGQIDVTMRIEFSGDLTDTKFAECNFNVTDAGPGHPAP
jgi:hypothetical protein